MKVSTKEEISRLLQKNLMGINPRINTVPTSVKYKGEDKVSDWSRQFEILNGEKPEKFLKILFDIKCEKWGNRYQEAISGKGMECNKILTLHSSSLLALLHFSSVTPSHPLNIQGVEYTDVHFEVKNRVFDNPSHIDVVLLNGDGECLFLESKFTEYLFSANTAFSDAYFEFFKYILPEIVGYPLQMVYPRKYDKGVGMGLKPTSESISFLNFYMDGIKQCFSHLIGLCQGPEEGEAYKWGEKVNRIRFGTILFKIPGRKYRAYSSFYSKTIGNLNGEKLRKAISSVNGIKDISSDKIEILPNVLTYQEVFKNFKLPEKVKKFYNL